jgi:hypothetical protein
LVEGSKNAKVRGFAVQVMIAEHEDALRIYETDNYKTLRGVIEFGEREGRGSTFRFVENRDKIMRRGSVDEMKRVRQSIR